MNPTQLIDQQIQELSDWRGSLLSHIRTLIHEADPDIKEEWKWSTGVWTDTGMVCAIGSFKDHLKINFFKGALLVDKDKLFTSGLEAKTTRAIDIFKDDTIDDTKLKDLFKTAVAFNKSH